jgi:hypothetical protein
VDKVLENRKTIRSKKALLIFLLILLAIVIGSIVYFNNHQKNSKQQTISQDDKNKINSKNIVETNNSIDVVKNFGEAFNNNTQELRNSNIGTWNKEKLDKAYFNLIYADKVSSFNDVYTLLDYISFAQKNGLDINNNSYGIDQKIRDEIKLRADASVEAFKKGVL